MKKLNYILIISSLLLFLLCLNAEAKYKKEIMEKNFSVDFSLPVFLEFRDVNGDLTFCSWDKNIVNIRVKKEVRVLDARRAEQLLRDTEVEISRKKNNIRLKISYPKMKGFFFWLRNHSRIIVTTEIMLPRSSNINCRTVDGSIYGENISGKVTARTTDGSIHLTDIKNLIKAKSTDGRIAMKNVEGNIEATTTDGDIEISGSISKLYLSSAVGDITLNLLPESRMEDEWRIRTIDGDVEFTVGKDFSADFYFQTSDGNIISKVPVAFTEFGSKKRLSGKINQGGYLLKIRTVEGDISIHTHSD